MEIARGNTNLVWIRQLTDNVTGSVETAATIVGTIHAADGPAISPISFVAGPTAGDYYGIIPAQAHVRDSAEMRITVNAGTDKEASFTVALTVVDRLAV